MNQAALFWAGCAFVLSVWGLRQWLRYRRRRAMWEQIVARLPDVEQLRRVAHRRLAQITAVQARRQQERVARFGWRSR